MSAAVRPVEEIEIETALFADDGVVPNNPRLPVLLLRGALRTPVAPAEIAALYAANGWRGLWRWTIFDYHHYHPNAHEALACDGGAAEVRLGGPSGAVFRIAAGDVLVLPAGVGHCRTASEPGFSVCGGYPAGQENYETVRAAPGTRRDALERIAATPTPESDPIYGAAGPLVDAWR